MNPRRTVVGPAPHDMGANPGAVLPERIEHPGAPPRRADLTPQRVVRESCDGVSHADSRLGQRYHAHGTESEPDRNRSRPRGVE